MVRAILAGRKTQTRRIIKPQPDMRATEFNFNPKGWPKNPWCARFKFMDNPAAYEITNQYKCRYGQPGDLLYCKETFIKGAEMEQGTYTLDSSGEYKPKIWFKASDPNLEWWDGTSAFPRKTTPWKSPLFLRKDDARIWLRNTGVRVERLQEISEKDAIKEVIEFHVPGDGGTGPMFKHYLKDKWGPSPVRSFQTLIQSIHGNQIWDENPWVFCISFEVLSTTGRPNA